MPENFDPQLGAYTQSGFLLDERNEGKYDRYAATLGAITAEWSKADSELGYYYSLLLLGPELAHKDVGAIAWEAFDAIEDGLPTKVKMLRIVASQRIDDGDLNKTFRKLLDELKKAGEGRNLVAHARWVQSPGHPGKPIVMRRMPTTAILTARDTPRIYSEQDLGDILTAIATAATALNIFVLKELRPRLKQFGLSDVIYMAEPE